MELDLNLAITEALGRPGVRVADSTAVSGGSIHRTQILSLSDGQQVFLKTRQRPPHDLLQREAHGLELLRQALPTDEDQLQVARCLGHGRGGGHSFLLLEVVLSAQPDADFQARFGRRLARLHRTASNARYGLAENNYLGETVQPNGWSEDWPSFFRDRRLGHQLGLARQRGLSDPELDRLGDLLLARLDQLLAWPAEPPTLLHGDLWGGNYLVDDRRRPVLIDPAVYYGRREADLAMTRLFGGFEPGFYSGYEEVWPLEEGAEERLAVYELYHLLNHLNLFGRGYRGGCMAILRRLT